MNEVVLSDDLNVITSEITGYKNMVGQSIVEIGRRLKHVKENDLVHGEWESYCLDNIGFTPAYANRYIKVYEEFGLSNQYTSIGLNKLYQLATLTEEDREKEHVTSSGESKMPDDMTQKELEELKRQLKSKETQLSLKEKRITSLTQKNEDLAFKVSQKPKVIEKEVLKEVPVTPHDYDGLKSDNKQLSAALKEKQVELEATSKRNNFIEKQYQEVLEDRKEDLDRKKKLEAMQKELERLANRKNKMSDQIDTIKQLSSLKYDVDKMLEKISPYYFNQIINTVRQDAVLEQSFMETVDSVQMWCDSMYKLMGTQNTFEGEIIND